MKKKVGWHVLIPFTSTEETVWSQGRGSANPEVGSGEAVEDVP